ncbi:hypothetical protein AMECASPLE_008616, partial [Ameca splendens]
MMSGSALTGVSIAGSGVVADTGRPWARTGDAPASVSFVRRRGAEALQVAVFKVESSDSCPASKISSASFSENWFDIGNFPSSGVKMASRCCFSYRGRCLHEGQEECRNKVKSGPRQHLQM